eukprot:m.176308 g.176308  ORF g.176308 m.176308 type:complete len:202 (-) comp15442_c1_seq4:5537-6142(-)
MQRDKKEGSLVHVPLKFCMVQDGVYRSEFPTRAVMPFLRKLNLKTVVLLSPDRLLKEVAQVFESQKAKVVHLGIRTWCAAVGHTADWEPLSVEIVKEALEIVLNVDHHPVLLLCKSGILESGIVVGCLRRLQSWNLTSCLAEYRMMAGLKTRYVAQQFIELFDTDLVTLPKNLPSWWLTEHDLKCLDSQAHEDDEDDTAEA